MDINDKNMKKIYNLQNNIESNLNNVQNFFENNVINIKKFIENNVKKLSKKNINNKEIIDIKDKTVVNKKIKDKNKIIDITNKNLHKNINYQTDNIITTSKYLKNNNLMYEFNDINEKEKINVFVVTDTIENKFSDNAILYKRSDNEVEYNGFHYNIFKIIRNNLSEKYDFNIKYSKTNEKNYNKFVEDTFNNKHDIVIAGFSHNSKRKELINYTQPLYLNSNSILYLEKYTLIKNILILVLKISIPLIILLLLGIICGLILSYVEPTRAVKIIKGNPAKIFRRHVLTGIASFFGKTGFLSENSTLTVSGIIVTVIFMIIIFVSIIIVQAKITTLNIELEKNSKDIDVDNLHKFKFLGLKGNNSPMKISNKGADVEFMETDSNNLLNYYIKNKKKYDGIAMIYTDAYSLLKENKNLKLEYHGLGIEPSSWIINKNKTELLDDINTEILKLKDNKILGAICDDFIKKKDSCLY